jgi:hypothetical protein
MEPISMGIFAGEGVKYVIPFVIGTGNVRLDCRCPYSGRRMHFCIKCSRAVIDELAGLVVRTKQAA